MNELPKGWVETSLEEINLRKPKSINPVKFPDEFFELYSVPSFDTNEPEIIKGSEIGSTKQIVKVGDVLICKINPRINRVWIVKNKTDYRKIASSEWIVVNTKEIINSALLRYEFSAPFFRSLLQSEVSGVGGSLTRARPKIVDNYKFPLPPLNEQQRIVAKLDKLFAHLDSLKARLEHVPELLKQFRQSVLTQAVTGKLTEDWREEKNVSKSWDKLKLENLVERIEAGKNFSCPEIPVTYGKVGLVKISAVTWGKFDPMETKTVEREDMISSKYFIKQNDFLISRANTIELVGASVIVDKIEHDIMLSDKVWRVLFKNDTTKFYTNLFLKSRLGRIEIEERASGNQNSMRNISQNKFKDINIPSPSLEEQKEIVRQVEALFEKVDLIERQYEMLKEKIEHLPQAILAKAFRGELVPQDPSDEPAEKLLERIQAESRVPAVKKKAQATPAPVAENARGTTPNNQAGQQMRLEM